MLVEPEGEGVLDHAGDEGRGLARGEALLRLAGELRLLHPHREHVAAARPDVLGRQLDAARQEVAELAELADGVRQAGAEAVDVGAALRGRDEVDVALRQDVRSSASSPSQATAQSTSSSLPREVAEEQFGGQRSGALPSSLVR